LTQLALDLLFRSLSPSILDPTTAVSLHASVAASDPSEAQVLSAQGFLDNLYGDPSLPSRANSRAATPMRVRHPNVSYHPTSVAFNPRIPGYWPESPKSIRTVEESSQLQAVALTFPSPPSLLLLTPSHCKRLSSAKSRFKGDSIIPPTPRRNGLQRPSVLPQLPDISSVTVQADPNSEYAVVISMYEVYNDRIFDLLTPASRAASTKDFRRRPLLFKSTEQSPDRKVVAGLRKVICGTMREALLVLEAGLHERRVAGTGSNSVSSRSHGFFCVEVKKRRKGRTSSPWSGSTLTIVDLAGSERARDARTQGATLAEAGKINESLMYLGQCLQMQSDLGNNTKVGSTTEPLPSQK
jgi:Kinesin motor domain